jgi:hypothetical protein
MIERKPHRRVGYFRVATSWSLSLPDGLCAYLFRASLKFCLAASFERGHQQSERNDGAAEPTVEARPAQEGNEAQTGKLDVIERTKAKLAHKQKEKPENRDRGDRDTLPPL